VFRLAIADCKAEGYPGYPKTDAARLDYCPCIYGSKVLPNTEMILLLDD